MHGTLFFQIFIIIFTNTCCYQDKTNIIIDFVKSINKPISVISSLCWAPRENVEVSKALNNNGISIVNKEGFSKDISIEESHYILFVGDTECSKTIDFIKKGEKYRYFGRPYRWLLFGGKYNRVKEIPEILYYRKILIDSEVILVFNEDENSKTVFYSLFRSEKTYVWKMELYGIWTSEEGLKKSSEMAKSTALRRYKLIELNFTVSHVFANNDSLKHLQDYRDKQVDTVGKMGYLTTQLLMQFLNSTSTDLFTDIWGYLINNTWTGESGQLARGESDLGGTAMFMLKERTYILDFIHCPVASEINFLFRQPPLSYNRNLYILAFRNSVWYCSLGLFFIILFALFSTALWEYKKMKRFSRHILRANVSDITIFILGAVCQQGSPVEMKRFLGRIVMIVLFLLSTFLYTSYSANIVALRQSRATNIRTLKDLYNSKLELGVHNSTYNRYYFSTATDPLRKAIYQNKIAPPGKPERFYSMEEGILKMRTEPFAIHIALSHAYMFVEKHFLESEKCGLTEIPFLPIQIPWHSCPKNSPYRELFKVGYMRLHEHGLNWHNSDKLYTKKPVCVNGAGSFESVNIIDSYPAFLVLAFGALIAFLILFFEIALHKFKNKL